jgi:hypothetical protein
MNTFCLMMDKNSSIEKVKMDMVDDEETEHRRFKKEVNFYCERKLKNKKKVKEQNERIESCDKQLNFEATLKLLEDEDGDKIKHMPVRKYFNNTFDTVINDACFQLKKEQSRDPKNVDLFTTKGSIKFVAQYILENLPEYEQEIEGLEDSQDGDGDA